MSKQEVKAIARELKTQVMIIGGFVVLLWAIELINSLLGRALNVYGVIPRTGIGLRGILFMPFLHGNFAHLAANTIPLIVLGWLIMLRKTSDFFTVSIVTMVVSGLGIWLTGAPHSVHIGASGLIFGYLGFLLLRGYFERRISSIILSLTVGLVYGSLIWGVLPSQPGISWQGHLFGLIGGGLAAKLLAKPK